MIENRRLRRWHLIYYLRVFHAGSGDLVGHVVDVSAGGMRLIGAAPVAPGRDLDLVLEVPDGHGGHVAVALRAHSLWSRADVNPRFHDSGLRLTDPSPEAIATIEALIRELHFSGPPDAAEDLAGVARPTGTLAGAGE